MSTTEGRVSKAEELDVVVDELRWGARRWAEVGLRERASLLAQVHHLAVAHAGAWVRGAAEAKSLAMDSPLLGEEWLSGPYSVATSAAALSASLARLADGESPVLQSQVRTGSDGRVRVDVLPLTGWDRILMNGYSAEVWMSDGVTAANVVAQAGLAQRNPQRIGGVGLVLGAGNITSIGVLDTLYELLAHNRAVLLKVNPVLNPIHDALQAVLAPLIDLDVVRIVLGGAEVGARLVEHEGIEHVHITGSVETHDAIVFGTGPEGDSRRATDEPLLDKPISSELGGVSPTIVLPTGWSRRDIDYQAQHVATQRLHNGGYNCIASQVVLVPASWPDLPRFLEALGDHFDGAPSRPHWYPGSEGRVEAAVETHPRSERRLCGRVILHVDADEAADVLTTEYFAPVLAVVCLPGEGSEFLSNAAEFANTRLGGTLGANVLAHPRAISALGPAFDAFLSSLRYGTIAVNAWTAVGYLTPGAPWGAFPGHQLNDAQSGIGVVHNAFLLDRTERTIVRGPFRPSPRSLATGLWTVSPKPPWFVTSRSGTATGRLLVDFAGHPSVRKLPRLLAHAIRS